MAKFPILDKTAFKECADLLILSDRGLYRGSDISFLRYGLNNKNCTEDESFKVSWFHFQNFMNIV